MFIYTFSDIFALFMIAMLVIGFITVKLILLFQDWKKGTKK